MKHFKAEHNGRLIFFPCEDISTAAAKYPGATLYMLQGNRWQPVKS